MKKIITFIITFMMTMSWAMLMVAATMAQLTQENFQPPTENLR